MSTESRVCLAGVGIAKTKETSLLGSATKALLDAGIHFDDVDKAVLSSRASHETLKAFDSRGIHAEDAKAGHELQKAYALLRSGKAQCVLVLTGDKSSSISLILMSDHMLWRHPYLKDTAVILDKSKHAQGGTAKGLHSLCQIVFAQRGWSQDSNTGSEVQVGNNCFILSRADGQSTPKWKDIEHKQDGRNRLGHNPANEERDIAYEDFEVVRALESRGSEPNLKRRGGDRAALAKL